MPSDLKSDIEKATRFIGRDWKKAQEDRDKKNRVRSRTLGRLRRYVKPRTVSIKEVADFVMKKAYLKASGGGQYYANARQIYYAARPLILEKCSRTTLDSRYFTQTILKDYLENYEPDWKVVWDARGHIKEPHTKIVVGLGGAEITNYISRWKADIDPQETQVADPRIDTIGPKHRYTSALFIEKEGFAPILSDAGFAERYDMAIMSAKGIPVGAACHLASKLSKEGVKIYVLHDFDKSGFTIVKTLRQGTRLSPGTPEVIDIGLRYPDIEGLISEPVSYLQDKDPRWYLEDECDATSEEANYLCDGKYEWVRKKRGYGKKWYGRRVELNAMTSDQFVKWIENKLEAEGVEKLVPDEEILADAYRRAVFLQAIEAEEEKIKKHLEKKEPEIPDDLSTRVREIIQKTTHTWDDAIYELAKKSRERTSRS